MFLVNVRKCLKIFPKVYVSSEDEEILALAEKNGAIPLRRPVELCGDAPNIHVYRHAMQQMPKDVVGFVAVQANSPSIRPSVIVRVKILMQDCQEVLTCHPDMSIYGSVWAMTLERLEKYGDPYKPDPDMFLLDESVDIHTSEDFKKALCQIKSRSLPK